ncbi:MAG: hypothetical protein K5694_04685 [Bacilli bacterium]|nr:hypothetical protein [Bacilli bacterium]
MKKKQYYVDQIDPRFFLGIAHRGLHNKEGIPENSMKAFENALKHDVAMEFDLHLTSDGHLVVFHDDDLKRMTGKDGVIEKMTLAHLRENYKLPDGSDIPTYQEVLNLVQEKVPLVVELKVVNGNYRKLSNAFVKEMGYDRDFSKYWVISFDPRALHHLYKKGYSRSLLIDNEHQWVWPSRVRLESIDIEWFLAKEERYMKYRKNHPVNVWTVETEDQVKEIIDYVDTITFQYVDVDYVRNALKAKRNG